MCPIGAAEYVLPGPGPGVPPAGARRTGPETTPAVAPPEGSATAGEPETDVVRAA
jgi:hypothetical protein